MQLVEDVLFLLSGVAVFMWGMKMLGRELEQHAGNRLRDFFKRISKRRVFDYGLGVGATAAIQSSSATTIMAIGLAHAGIVSIRQGAGIILGAKVGTTVTAFMVALSGVGRGGIGMDAILAAIAFVGVIIVYATDHGPLNKYAYMLIGFGMLFAGLEMMENAIGGADSILGVEMAKLFCYEVMQSPPVLVILGLVFTAFVLQSSSAASGIFIAFLATGVIGTLDQALYLMMGANIGTCSDGIMASLTTNEKGKRLALFHVITSTMGAVVFTVVLMVFRDPIVGGLETLFPNSPQFGMATYNLAYNIIYTLGLLPFLDHLMDFVTRMVKAKAPEKTGFKYINPIFSGTPLVAIEQALKEVHAMAQSAKENLDLAFGCFVEGDVSHKREIRDNERRNDDLTKMLTEFFARISVSIKAQDSEKVIAGLYHVVNDLERLGDHAVSLSRETNYMKDKGISLASQTVEELRGIYASVSKLFELGMETFISRGTEHFEQLDTISRELKQGIARSKTAHVERLSSGVYSAGVSKSVNMVLDSLQRITAHIVNIAFSVRSATGSKTEALGSVRMG